MVTFRESLKNASQAAVCTLLAGTEAASWLGGSLRPGGGENAFAEAVRRQRLISCSNPGTEVVVGEPPPFLGGQCDCARYEVDIWAGRAETPSSESYIGRFRTRGPIGPFRASAGFVFGFSRGPWNSSAQSYPGCQAYQERLVFPFAVGGVNEFRRLEIISAPDGDDCGSLPGGPVPPYVPVTIVRNITYIDNSNTEVTQEGDFNILAPVFIGGAIIAPITVNLGGLEIPLNFSLETGEITFDFSREYVENPTPIVTENPGENPTDDDPGVESDDLFYGLIVYSVPSGINPVTSQIAQDSAPTLRLPRTGNVYFQVPMGDRVSWIGPIPVQMENQLIMVPGGLGATGYRLAENTGWNLSAIEVGKPT